VSGPPRLPRNVWAVTLTSFFTDISSEMLVNLIPLFLVGVLGVRTTLVGTIEGVAESTASLLKLAAGMFSDRLGRRKPLAVAGYAVSTLSKPFLYGASSWAHVLAVRFADRVGKGIRTAPRDALVADSVDASQRGIAFGLHRAGDTAGAVVGLGLALVIVLARQSASAELLRETFRTVVLVSLIPAALAVAILALGARETGVGAASGTRPRLGFAGLGRDFRFFIIVVVLFTLGNSSDAFLLLRARDTGLPVAGILGMLITMNLVYAIVAGPAGALSDRLGRRRFLLAGWLVYAGVYLGFASASAGWQTWGLMAIYGVYYGLTAGAVRAYVADLVPAERRGTAYGVLAAAVGIAALPASIIAGLLWQGVAGWPGLGAPAPFVVGAALALVASALLAFGIRERNRPPCSAGGADHASGPRAR